MLLLSILTSLLVTICILPADGVSFTENPNLVSSTELNSHISKSLPTDNKPAVPIPSCPLNPSPASECGDQNQTTISGISTLPDLSVPGIVKLFAGNFIQRIEQDPTMKNAFDYTRLTPDQARDLTYDIVFIDHSKANGVEPDHYATLVADAMKSSHEHATADSIVRLFAYGVGQNMFNLRLLTPENVLDFSDKFLEKMRENINAVVAHTPEADIRAVTKGFMDFLLSVNLYHQDNADAIAVYFANELNGLRKYNPAL